MHWIHKICRLHFQSRENEQCQGSQNSSEQSCGCLLFHIPLVFRKSGVLRTVNGAACWSDRSSIYIEFSAKPDVISHAKSSGRGLSVGNDVWFHRLTVKPLQYFSIMDCVNKQRGIISKTYTVISHQESLAK